MKPPKTIQEAVARAKCTLLGSPMHTEAKAFMRMKYREAFPHDLHPSTKSLWSWIEGYLELEEASYGPTPLG